MKKNQHFDVYDYIIQNEDPMMDSNFSVLDGKDDFYMKTECYYLIKYEQVFGTIILKKDCLVFEPSRDSKHN